MRRRPVAALLVGMVVALGLGCGGQAPRPAAIPGAPLPRIAVLPFDNLTDEGGAGETMTLVFFTTIGQAGRYEPVESGIVAAVLDSMRIRLTTTLSAEQLSAIGQRLDAQRLLVGSVLESGSVRTDDGDLPSVGVTVKLIDPATGRVQWTRMGFKTGGDKETVFGWGRERSRPKLAARLAQDILRDLPAPADSTHSEGGSR
jgi:TolB-like protein